MCSMADAEVAEQSRRVHHLQALLQAVLVLATSWPVPPARLVES
jgi:hypothetical protein